MKQIHDDDNDEDDPRWYATKTLHDDSEDNDHMKAMLRPKAVKKSITKKATNMVYELDTKD